MKCFVRLVACVGVLIVSMHADASDRFRASYEIAVAQDGVARSIRTSTEFVSGKAFEQELDPYRIELSPSVEEGGEYELILSVRRLADDPQGVPVSVSHTLRGSVGTPAEFSVTLDAFVISGALMITAQRP